MRTLAKIRALFKSKRPIFLAIAAVVGMSGLTSWLLRITTNRAEVSNWLPTLLVWGVVALLITLYTKRSHITLALVVGAGIAVRAPLLGAPPLLSDDLYRYLVEGMALNSGINPFLIAPNQLPALFHGLVERVNHADLKSIYPPVALLWFRTAAAIGAEVWRLQLMTMAADLVIIWQIYRYRESVGTSTWPALLYALHPLPALESTVSAHLEIPAIAIALCGLAALQHGRGATGNWLLMMGAGVKLFPATLLAATTRSSAQVWGLVAGLLTIGLLSGPLVDAGWASFDSMSLYASEWSFNGFLFTPASALLGDQTRPLLMLIALLFSAVILYRHRTDPVRLWYLLGLTFLLLTPTAHPWYALWALVPGLMLGSAAIGVVALSMIASYGVLDTIDPVTGVWHESTWIYLLTWTPALAALFLERVTAWRDVQPTP